MCYYPLLIQLEDLYNVQCSVSKTKGKMTQDGSTTDKDEANRGVRKEEQFYRGYRGPF